MLTALRISLSRHAVLIELQKLDQGTVLFTEDIVSLLNAIKSVPDYSYSTRASYANKLALWFSATGYFVEHSRGWLLEDQENIDLFYASSTATSANRHQKSSLRRRGIFTAPSPPHKVLEVLNQLEEKGQLLHNPSHQPGVQKALDVLSRFQFAYRLDNQNWKPTKALDDYNPNESKVRLFEAAVKQESIVEALDYVEKSPDASGLDLGSHIGKVFSERWSIGSQKRTGNALMRWVDWIQKSKKQGQVLPPEVGSKGPQKGKYRKYTEEEREQRRLEKLKKQREARKLRPKKKRGRKRIWANFEQLSENDKQKLAEMWFGTAKFEDVVVECKKCGAPDVISRLNLLNIFGPRNGNRPPNWYRPVK